MEPINKLTKKYTQINGPFNYKTKEFFLKNELKINENISNNSTKNLKAIISLQTKIDENTLNGILNGKIQPQRDDLIQMSLVLNIDLKKTNFMLSLAECESLSYKESRDSLIICAIKNHYSINKTNIMLSTCNLVKI